VSESARVLTPDGVLTISIVHPFIDQGSFATYDADAPFVVLGTYYSRRHFTRTESHGGRVMHFAGWSHPLEDYTAALHATGLVITALREARPQGPDDAPVISHWGQMPVFLWINAKHLP
jgi:hypothetical protein